MDQWVFRQESTNDFQDHYFGKCECAYIINVESIISFTGSFDGNRPTNHREWMMAFLGLVDELVREKHFYGIFSKNWIFHFFTIFSEPY